MQRNFFSFRISFLIFCALIFSHCRHGDLKTSVSTMSENDKVVGLRIRGPVVVKDDLPSRLKVQLIKPGEQVAVLGDYKIDNEEIIFEPLVPFTHGLSYEILLDDSVIAELTIPLGNTSTPEVLSIYPTQDTVPENLLKMYVEFSEPMVEGNSLGHIVLLRNGKDTVEGTFLDLKPELWNQEGTVLTLWLDPGRIKRGLIPNRELGSPLVAGSQYTLHVLSGWKSKGGFPLKTEFTKSFFTVSRDETSPQSLQWKMIAPRSGTRDPLIVKFHESLDPYILRDIVRIEAADKKQLRGKVEILEEERILHFTPADFWGKGRFTFTVETKLEDLAGNNLVRLFDQDIRNRKKIEERYFSREFEVR